MQLLQPLWRREAAGFPLVRRRRFLSYVLLSFDHHGCKTGGARLCHFSSKNAASTLPLPASDPVRNLSLFLSFCNRERTVVEGRAVHHHIIRLGLERDPHLEPLLLHMYCACEAIAEALLLFSCLCEKEVSTWNSLIRMCTQKGRHELALQVFYQMLHEGAVPDKFTFINLLSLFGQHACLAEGLRIHISLKDTPSEADAVVATALINMYGRNGMLLYARKTYEQIRTKDLVLCTAMIGVLARHKKIFEAFHVFSQMQGNSYKPNKVTFLCLVDACAECRMHSEGMLVHHVIIESASFVQVMIDNALIDMYGRCGDLDGAARVFDAMTEKTDVSWSVIIAAHTQNQRADKAFRHFQKMFLYDIKPNRAILVTVLESCVLRSSFAEGAIIHVYVLENGCDVDQIIATALICFYNNCGSLQDARKLFISAPRKDVITWNAMICGCTQFMHQDSIYLFHQMLHEQLKPNSSTCVSVLDSCARHVDLTEGKRIHAFIVDNNIEQDVILQTAILNMYGKCGEIKAACSIFQNMLEKNMITWNAMISIHAENGNVQEAILLLKQMLERRLQPSSISFVGMLDACGESVFLEEGQWIHAFLVDADVELDSSLGTALISMYGKCGCLENAYNVFEHHGDRSLGLVTAFMSVLAKHGLCDRVFQLLLWIHKEGLNPNHVTFVSILTACNHHGLIGGAYQWLSLMHDGYDVRPSVDHYICFADILGRAGLLNEAECLMNTMPFQTPRLLLLHLLGACRQHMDIDRGNQVSIYLLEIDAKDYLPYVIVSNIYAVTDQELC